MKQKKTEIKYSSQTVYRLIAAWFFAAPFLGVFIIKPLIADGTDPRTYTFVSFTLLPAITGVILGMVAWYSTPKSVMTFKIIGTIAFAAVGFYAYLIYSGLILFSIPYLLQLHS